MSTLTTEQVAERLHSSPYTVRQYARAGDIEAAFVGRRWLFTEQAVTDYLAGKSNRVTRPRRRRSA